MGIVEDASFDRGSERANQLAFLDERDDTYEPSAAILLVAQLFQEKLVVLLIGCVFACKSRGMNSGLAVKRVHFEPGIVGEEISVGKVRIVEGLLRGVRLESISGFVRRRDAYGERADIEVGRR